MARAHPGAELAAVEHGEGEHETEMASSSLTGLLTNRSRNANYSGDRLPGEKKCCTLGAAARRLLTLRARCNSHSTFLTSQVNE